MIRVPVEAERSTKSAAAATHKMKRKPLPIAGSGFFITVHGQEFSERKRYGDKNTPGVFVLGKGPGSRLSIQNVLSGTEI